MIRITPDISIGVILHAMTVGIFIWFACRFVAKKLIALDAKLDNFIAQYQVKPK